MATTDTPTDSQYVVALRAIFDGLTSAERHILRTQLEDPAHELTATACARIVGSDSYRAGNLRYGGLGRKLCDALAPYRPPVRADGSPEYWAVLSSGERDANGEFVWTLRAELVTALKTMSVKM